MKLHVMAMSRLQAQSSASWTAGRSMPPEPAAGESRQFCLYKNYPPRS